MRSAATTGVLSAGVVVRHTPVVQNPHWLILYLCSCFLCRKMLPEPLHPMRRQSVDAPKSGRVRQQPAWLNVWHIRYRRGDDRDAPVACVTRPRHRHPYRPDFSCVRQRQDRYGQRRSIDPWPSDAGRGFAPDHRLRDGRISGCRSSPSQTI